MEAKKITLKELMDILLEMEQNIDVSSWYINDIQIWPLIKHTAFFDFKDDSSRLKKIVSNGFIFQKAISLLKSVKNSKATDKLSSDINSLPQAEILYAAANSHYVQWEGQYTNRYFDPIKENTNYNTIYFNYSKNDLDNGSVKYPHFNIHNYISNIKSDIKLKNTAASFDDLLKESKQVGVVLENISNALNVPLSVLKNKIINRIYSVSIWRDKWGEVVDRVKPQVAMLLCYYDMSMYGLILALKARHIPSIDMQHGGQGVSHPAYSYAPNKNVDLQLLPNYFWVWDEPAKANLERWLGANSSRIILGGNPWIRFFAEKQNLPPIFDKKRYIICTLPADKSYYRLMPDGLLRSIKNAEEDFVFGFRFHPKTTSKGKENLIQLCKDNNISHKMDFDKANALPLPYLMAASWGHISVGSIGSVSEAAIIGVKKNIILDQIGKNYYQDLMQQGKAYFFDIDSDEDVITFMNSISTHTDTRTKDTVEYADIFHQIVKK